LRRHPQGFQALIIKGDAPPVVMFAPIKAKLFAFKGGCGILRICLIPKVSSQCINHLFASVDLSKRDASPPLYAFFRPSDPTPQFI
jgi:hypothetical protein